MNSVIPKVTAATVLTSDFRLTAECRIICDNQTRDLALLLAEYLAPATGYNLAIVDNDSAENGDIKLTVNGTDKADELGFANEEYTLSADPLTQHPLTHP